MNLNRPNFNNGPQQLSTASRKPESQSSHALLRFLRTSFLLALTSCATPKNIPDLVPSCPTPELCPMPATLPNRGISDLARLTPDDDHYGNPDRIPTSLSKNERPPLWACEPLEVPNGMHSSLTHEAAIYTVKFLKEAQDRERERLLALGTFKRILDSHRTKTNGRGGPLFASNEKVWESEDIYNSNLALTQEALDSWSKLLNEAGSLKSEIRSLVELETAVGTDADQCAKNLPPQSSQTLARVIPRFSRRNVGLYVDYDENLPKGVDLPPYICANGSMIETGQTDSYLVQWAHKLESLAGEHIQLAMEREDAFIVIKDKYGMRDDWLLKSRNGNQAILAKWRCALLRVSHLKQSILNTLMDESNKAKALKRCERIDQVDENPTP